MTNGHLILVFLTILIGQVTCATVESTPPVTEVKLMLYAYIKHPKYPHTVVPSTCTDQTDVWAKENLATAFKEEAANNTDSCIQNLKDQTITAKLSKTNSYKFMSSLRLYVVMDVSVWENCSSIYTSQTFLTDKSLIGVVEKIQTANLSSCNNWMLDSQSYSFSASYQCASGFELDLNTNRCAIEKLTDNMRIVPKMIIQTMALTYVKEKVNLPDACNLTSYFGKLRNNINNIRGTVSSAILPIQVFPSKYDYKKNSTTLTYTIKLEFWLESAYADFQVIQNAVEKFKGMMVNLNVDKKWSSLADIDITANCPTFNLTSASATFVKQETDCDYVDSIPWSNNTCMIPKWPWYEYMHNTECGASAKLPDQNGKDAFECKKACDDEPKCKAFDYKSTKFCRFFESSCPSNQLLTKRTGYYYFKKGKCEAGPGSVCIIKFIRDSFEALYSPEKTNTFCTLVVNDTKVDECGNFTTNNCTDDNKKSLRDIMTGIQSAWKPHCENLDKYESLPNVAENDPMCRIKEAKECSMKLLNIIGSAIVGTRDTINRACSLYKEAFSCATGHIVNCSGPGQYSVLAGYSTLKMRILDKLQCTNFKEPLPFCKANEAAKCISNLNEEFAKYMKEKNNICKLKGLVTEMTKCVKEKLTGCDDIYTTVLEAKLKMVTYHYENQCVNPTCLGSGAAVELKNNMVDTLEKWAIGNRNEVCEDIYTGGVQTLLENVNEHCKASPDIPIYNNIYKLVYNMVGYLMAACVKGDSPEVGGKADECKAAEATKCLTKIVDGSIIGIGSPANNEFCTVLATSKSCIKTNLASCSYNTFLRFDYMLNTIDRTLLDMKLCSNIPTPRAKCSKDEFDRCIFEMNEHVYAFTMGHMTLSNMCLKTTGKTGCASSIRSDCSPIGKNILDNAYKLLKPMCEDDVAECTESTPIRCLERFSYNAFEALVYNTGKESTLCRKKQKHEVEKCFKKYEKKCDAEVTKRYSKSLEALTKLSDMICKDEVYDFGKVYENVECQSDELKYCAKHAMETMLFGMAFKDKAVSKLFVCSAYKNGKSCFEGKAKKCSDFLKFTVLRSMYPSEMMAKAMECPDTEEKPKCGKKELDKAKKCMKELSKEIKHKGKGKKRGKDICKHIEKKITEKSKCITDAVQECPYGKKRFFQYAISAIKYRCTEPDKKCYSSDATRCLSNYLKHTSTHLLALKSKKACKILKDRRYHKCLLKVRNTCDQSTFDSINRAFTRYEDFLKSICKGGQFLDTYSKEPMACKASLVSIAFNLIKLSSSIIPYLSWGKKITATFCKEYSSTFVSTKKLAIDANCSGKFQHDIAYMLYYLKTSFSASCESGTIIKSDKECTILKVGSCLMKEKENLKDSLMNGFLQTACATLQNATLCDTLTGKCCPTASYVIETAKTDFTQTYCEAKSLKCLQSKEATCLETYIQDGFIYLNTQNSTSSNDVCSDARKTEVTKCLSTLETSCDKTTKTRYDTVVTVMQTLLKNSCVETPTIILPDKEAPECKAETAFKKIKHISKTIRKAVVMDKFFRQKTCIQFNKDRMEIEKMILSCSSGLLMKIYKYLSTLINITSKFECAVDYQIEGREEEDDDLVPPPPKPSCNHEGASTCIKDFTMNLKEAETGNNKICTDSRQEKFTKLKLCVNERVAGCDREKRLYLEKKVVASTYKYSKQCDKSICYESKNYKCITEVGDKILDAMMKGGYRIKHICSESYKLVKKIEKCFGKVGEDSFKCSQKPAEIANRFTAIKGQLVGDNSICNDDIPDTDEEESKECRFKEAEKYLKVFFSLFWKATVTDDSIIKSSICKVYYDIERKITMDIKECSGAVQFRFISVLAKKRKSLVASKICNDLPPVKENCTNEKVYSVCTKMVLDTKVDEETRCSRLTEAIDCVKKQMNNCPGEKQFIHYYFNGLFQGILRQCMKPEVKCDSTETLQCSKDYYSKFMKGIFAGKYNSELCRKFATTDSTKCMTKLKMYCENGPNKVKYVRMKRILEAIGTTKNEICQKYDAKTIEMGPGADECKFELLKAKIVEYFGRTFKASADNEETQKKFCRDYKAMLLNVVSESKKCSVYTQRILYIALHVVHAINKEACEDVTPKADEDTCQIDEAKQCLEELTKTATDVVIEDDMTAVCSSFNENLKCVVNKLAGCVKIAYVSVKNAMRIQESVFKEKVGTKCTVVPPVVTGEKCAQSAPMKCLIELEYARVNAYYSQKYETFCDKMKEKKECIDDEATACTADQETRKKMVLHHLEKCADNYCKTTIAKKEGCDYYTAKACVKTFSEGLTKNFVDGKDVCTDMAKMVSCIGENMKTCKGGYQSMIDRGVLGIIKCHKLKEKCPHVQYAPWLSSTCRLMAAKTCIGELEEKLENKKEAAVSLCPLMKSSKACLTVNIKDCPAYASKEIKIRFEAMERLMSKSCEKRFEVVVNVARLELNMGETKSFKFKVQESPSIPCKGKSSCIVRVIASEILTDSKRSYNYCKRYKRGIYWLAFGSHGKDITEANWKGEHEISVTSRNIGVRPSKPVNRMIEISYAVYLNGVRGSETVVKKIQVSVSSQYKIRPFCKAVGDPHYTTFDKAYYNNYKIGAFLLYENTESDSEVQTFLEPCARRASCNCAVSIRHRGNIFTVDACLKPSRRGKCFGKNRRRKKCRKPKRRPFNYKFFIEDKLAPGMKLYYGRDKLQVILPSGTSVTVKKTKWIMSVYVSAAPSDFRKTRGLCGWFNGNKANDLIMKDGSVIKLTRYPSRFHKEYKIPVRETMIYFPKKVKVVKKPPTRLCLVAKGKDAICGDDKATETCYIIQRGMKDKTKEFLKTSTKLRFEEKKEEQVKVPKVEETPNANNNNNNNNEGDAQTEQRERRRRAVEDDPVDLPEEHPNFNPISNDTDWTPPWTKALAEEACGDYLFQNEMYTKCALVANVPSNDLDLSTTLAQCVEDIQASGDLNASAIGALESMKASCQNAIDADPDFADTPAGAAIVTFMVANSCPGQCNSRGKCEGGNCTCYPGWDGESCSVNMTEAPIPTNIGQDGICNPRVTNCREALVTASNIFNSDDLSCHVTLLKITTSAETVGSPVISKANLVTESQVICVLPTKNDSYSVSLSNNKINPGDSLLYLVFDPNCHECNAETPTCTKKAGICNLPSGDCMAPGESKVTDSCLYCDAKKNPYGYTLRQTDACLLKHNKIKRPTTLDTTDIIIIVVVCVCIVLGALGVVIYKHVKAKKAATKEKYSDAEPLELRNETPPPPPLPIEKTAVIEDPLY